MCSYGSTKIRTGSDGKQNKRAKSVCASLQRRKVVVVIRLRLRRTIHVARARSVIYNTPSVVLRIATRRLIRNLIVRLQSMSNFSQWYSPQTFPRRGFESDQCRPGTTLTGWSPLCLVDELSTDVFTAMVGFVSENWFTKTSDSPNFLYLDVLLFSFIRGRIELAQRRRWSMILTSCKNVSWLMPAARLLFFIIFTNCRLTIQPSH